MEATAEFPALQLQPAGGKRLRRPKQPQGQLAGAPGGQLGWLGSKATWSPGEPVGPAARVAYLNA